jgi:hypothetical protein
VPLSIIAPAMKWVTHSVLRMRLLIPLVSLTVCQRLILFARVARPEAGRDQRW